MTEPQKIRITDEERMRQIGEVLRDASMNAAAAIAAFAQALREFDRGWADGLHALCEQGRRGAVAGEALKERMIADYGRLRENVKRGLPLLWPSRAKERAVLAAVRWIGLSLSPEPHTAREFAALVRYHRAHRDLSLVSQIIDDALDRF